MSGRALPATPKKIYPRASAKCTSVRITNIGKARRQHESPNNLSTYRWRHPLPDPNRDEELVALARAGDRKACAELVSNYHRVIIGRATKHYRLKPSCHSRFYAPNRSYHSTVVKTA